MKGLNTQKEEVDLSLGIDGSNFAIPELSSTMKCLIQMKTSIQIKKSTSHLILYISKYKGLSEKL